MQLESKRRSWFTCEVDLFTFAIITGNDCRYLNRGENVEFYFLYFSSNSFFLFPRGETGEFCFISFVFCQRSRGSSAEGTIRFHVNVGFVFFFFQRVIAQFLCIIFQLRTVILANSDSFKTTLKKWLD